MVYSFNEWRFRKGSTAHLVMLRVAQYDNMVKRASRPVFLVRRIIDDSQVYLFRRRRLF